MYNPAVTIEGLSKSYNLQHRVQSYPTFRETLVRAVAAPWRRFRRLGGHLSGDSDEQELFWALKDVSLKIEPGEVVGIIGRNGAGKSTLLKILSRITEPSSGRVVLNGRVASLLEVGTGFHPELSGRENIYLNGAILGMKRAEVRSRFDEIVAFAEVERFLDTPVKHYSSGMYVRLAFAVAAHLEPEILIVDEVLAVGDVAFQRKCLGRMEKFAQEGERTVLFVSHNLASLRALCTRGVFLQQGRVVQTDTIDSAVQAYLTSLEDQATDDLSKITARRGQGRVRLQRLVINSGAGGGSTVSAGGFAQLSFQVAGSVSGLACVFTIYDQMGQPLAMFDSRQHGTGDVADAPPQEIICTFDEFLLAPGRYRVNVAVYGDHTLQDHIEGAAFIDVVPGMVRGRPSPADGSFAKTLLPHRWTTPPSAMV